MKFIPDRQLPDKAIDLMDEALASVKMTSVSKPVELEKLEKELRTLEIELEAKKAEAPPVASDIPLYEGEQKKSPSSREMSEGQRELQQLEKEIASKREQIQSLASAWKKERDLIDTMKDMREEIELLKNKANALEREGNFGEVAKIRYGDIPEKEKSLESTDDALKKLHENGKSYLKERVTSEDIAEIVAKWTGIPATKLLETEKEKLLHLEDYLRKQVVGQDAAIKAVSNAIRRARAGLAEDEKPLGSFLFLGPT